ncbi:FtsK/SpoIIIE domain-containing protein [Streptomyces sp. NPDC006012]|uniref:FtsK/SpoIIIE domain-containing protein n=1 Tax=Streptomyces sp. NPDC006012 TaxID=3364739 RepID=UPI0036736662
MQIRLTVVDPLGPSPRRGRAASRDVLVTAPAGTALAAVTSALAATVAGDGGPGRDPSNTLVVLYAGAERLDARRSTLGEPPLVDGAVLALGTPAEPEPHPELDDAPTQLHVVAGPDAGGVHLLHGGRITVGRSADADVPLDDPDVSRLHCAVTVGADGRVSVADLDSTNGTVLGGTRVDGRPAGFPPGALLRIGESALRLTPSAGPGARIRTAPDGEGCVRVTPRTGSTAGGEGTGLPGNGQGGPGGRTGSAATHGSGADGVSGGYGGGSAHGGGSGAGRAGGAGAAYGGAGASSGATQHAYGTAGMGAPGAAPRAQEHHPADMPVVPGQAGAPRIENRGGARTTRSPDTHVGRFGFGGPGGPGHPDPGSGPAPDPYAAAHGGPDGLAPDPRARAGHTEGAPGTRPRGGHPETGPDAAYAPGAPGADAPQADGRTGTPVHGTDLPQGGRRRGGLGAWARRLAGGRPEPADGGPGPYDTQRPGPADDPSPGGPQRPETWPDPAALLLTALGPGPRLWERGPGHPQALTVRLGTADRTAPNGSGPLLPAVPVTADLREAGALGLAGPRPRLSGLARAVLAQLVALHSPDDLEIVLISADHSRPLAERTAEWSWLGWLPHVRPGHGQDCRLLLAYDREQAAARTEELLRRLESRTGDTPAGSHPSAAGPAAPYSSSPSGHGGEAAGGFPGPYTVVVVDGDPGGAGLREVVTRLALAGPRAGVHVMCLAETPPAPAHTALPAAGANEAVNRAAYEAACEVAPAFRACGAIALLGGDVATALHLMRVAQPTAAPAPTSTAAPLNHAAPAPPHHSSPAPPQHSSPVPVGPGAFAAVDAVSLAWAERFARALAPLRTDGAVDGHRARVAAPLPQSARLLDELGLARATPASLMARWADAADDTESRGGRAWAVLGAGPRGPLGTDLVAEGPHLLVEGPPGSGRTELLRALVASLAAAERPDRLGIVLIDGRDGAGTGGEGLRVCTDIPHVTTHLTANDPVRMREFAQSLSAELKRRAELLGRTGFAEWHAHGGAAGRIVAQRTPPGRPAPDGGDLDPPPTTTMRLRTAAARREPAGAAAPLPRLVVVVDDLDALVSPALGAPGRPAAGSVLRALEAVAREGERLGVHLVAATAPGGRTAETEPARRAALRVALDAPSAGPDEPAPGRGRLATADGRVTAFQAGRVTGRIPRTATQRPTVVPLEWHRMGDPPARRPVRELGNGPTDLALLASAVERAAREVSAAEVPSLL